MAVDYAKEAEMLFPKSYKCPVCDFEFKSLAVRTGKARGNGQDDDLRPKFIGIDTIKYDAVVCPNCGYGALARYFDHLVPVERRKIELAVKDKFKGSKFSADYYSYDEAIIRYKMVMMCDMFADFEFSRKSYTCLKLAWVIRGKIENEPESMTQEEIDELQNYHDSLLDNAYMGYTKAFTSEHFPMSGMDEPTLSYLVAQLGYKKGDYNGALRMLSGVMSNREVSPRLKEKALDLKEAIRKAMEAEEQK